MKIGKSNPSASKPSGFSDLAKAHVDARGGVWFVADKQKTPQQWRAWIVYFAWLDGQTTPRGRKATTFGALEKLTVPAEWPREFDASAQPPFPELRGAFISVERRKQLAGMLRAIVADHQLQEQRALTWRDMTPAQAEAKLAERAASYVRNPPTVSTQVMARYLDGICLDKGLDDAIDF